MGNINLKNKAQESWARFDYSTFTFVGRNDRVVDYILRLRGKAPETLVILGSGLIEPFTIAALPGLDKCKIIAVDINEEIVHYCSKLKNGETLSWESVAEISRNPGRKNSDLLDPKRLSNEMAVLEELGSKENLGEGFNLKSISIPKSIRDRVTLVQDDALGFMQAFPDTVDMILDFFLQVNINKLDKGIKYTEKMILENLGHLSPDGVYIIGDTGKNLPITLQHFDKNKGLGVLNLLGLVHAVNLFGNKLFVTSHYLVSSLDPKSLNTEEIKDQVIQNLKANRILKASDTTTYINISLRRMKEIATRKLLLAYVSNNDGSNQAWFSKDPSEIILNELLPSPGDEISQRIVFPEQKSHNKTSGTYTSGT